MRLEELIAGDESPRGDDAPRDRDLEGPGHGIVQENELVQGLLDQKEVILAHEILLTRDGGVLCNLFASRLFPLPP